MKSGEIIVTRNGDIRI